MRRKEMDKKTKFLVILFLNKYFIALTFPSLLTLAWCAFIILTPEINIAYYITLSGAAIIASWIFHSMNSVSFALSVSVVFKNGNALTTTAFYNDRLIFINSFTFYGYRYGSWIIPDIDDWRGHP